MWNEEKKVNELKTSDFLDVGGDVFKLDHYLTSDLADIPSDKRVSTLKNRLSQLLVDQVIDGWAVFTDSKEYRLTFQGRQYLFSFASSVDKVYKERRKELEKTLGATDQERRSDKWPLS